MPSEAPNPLGQSPANRPRSATVTRSQFPTRRPPPRAPRPWFGVTILVLTLILNYIFWMRPEVFRDLLLGAGLGNFTFSRVDTAPEPPPPPKPVLPEPEAPMVAANTTAAGQTRVISYQATAAQGAMLTVIYTNQAGISQSEKVKSGWKKDVVLPEGSPVYLSVTNESPQQVQVTATLLLDGQPWKTDSRGGTYAKSAMNASVPVSDRSP